MSVSTKLFGKTHRGEAVDIIELANGRGMSCGLIQYGAAIQSLVIADKGVKADVVLGFDELGSYENPTNPSHGAVVGRHANRIENAEFELGGKLYRLYANEGRNNLHSAPKSFGTVVWDYEILDKGDVPAVRFSYFSKDGEAGFPGNLNCTVTYMLTSDNALSIEYEAVSDQDTVINLTNHAYFNLAGGGDVLGHELQIEADEYNIINSELLPDGRLMPVGGTPFDFLSPKKIGQDIDQPDEQLSFAMGYDHNFILRGDIGSMRHCAKVKEPLSGRTMIVETTSPGVQLYTGNQLMPSKGKGGAVYDRYGGLCLETQYYPNSLKHTHFPSPVFRAGDHFRHKTVFRFE